MKVKLNKTLRLNGINIPKGTVLAFGNESFAIYRGKRITKKMIGIESDEPEYEVMPEGCEEGGDAVATTVIEMLRSKYPDGFTANQIAEDLGDSIEGAVYSLNDKEDNDGAVLTLKTDDDREIKIYLAKDESDVYTVTGDYDATECDEITAGTESFLGKLALATRRRNHAARRK